MPGSFRIEAKVQTGPWHTVRKPFEKQWRSGTDWIYALAASPDGHTLPQVIGQAA